nr:hypothetical protein [Sulfitobacter pontiacus]
MSELVFGTITELKAVSRHLSASAGKAMDRASGTPLRRPRFGATQSLLATPYWPFQWSYQKFAKMLC